MASKHQVLEIKKSNTSGEVFWHVKGTNGKIIGTGGETFKRVRSALKGARTALGLDADELTSRRDFRSPGHGLLFAFDITRRPKIGLATEIV